MAEAIGLASSLLSLAAFGIDTVKILRQFISALTEADSKIKNLSANISLTSSILTSISIAIKECAQDLTIHLADFTLTRDNCLRDLNLLRSALDAHRDYPGNPAQPDDAARVTVWGKLVFALGGEEKYTALVLSFETSKSNLQLLLESLNFKILKNLNKKQLLSEDEAKNFRSFVACLPDLVRNLQMAGLMTAPQAAPIVEGVLSEQGPIPTGSDPELHHQSSEPCIQAPRHESSIASNLTMPSHTNNFATMNAGKSERGIAVGDDHAQSLDSGDLESIYEGWLVQPAISPSRKTITFYCLTARVYDNNSPQQYRSIPLSTTKSTLKAHVEPSKPRGKVLLQPLCPEAYKEAEDLLDERNKNAPRPYGWELTAIRDYPQARRRWTFRTSRLTCSSYLLVLRGARLSEEKNALPDRMSNPWATLNPKGHPAPLTSLYDIYSDDIACFEGGPPLARGGPRFRFRRYLQPWTLGGAKKPASKIPTETDHSLSNAAVGEVLQAPVGVVVDSTSVSKDSVVDTPPLICSEEMAMELMDAFLGTFDP